MSGKGLIYIIDDDDAVRDSLDLLLSAAGFETMTFDSAETFLASPRKGARGCLLGRAFVYGLGALGEAGVSRALEIIHNELSLSMAFCGHTDIEAVGPSILLPPCPWPGASALPHGPLHPGRDARLPTGDLS